MSELLSISLKKSDVGDSLVIFTIFTIFPPFCPKANRFCCSSLSRSFLKSHGSDFLLVLLTKERPWKNCSYHSLQKSDRERIAPYTLYKRATVSDLLLLLMAKEQSERFARFHEQIAFLLFRSQKTSNSLRKTDKRIPNPGFWSRIAERLLLKILWSKRKVLQIFKQNNLFFRSKWFFENVNLNVLTHGQTLKLKF